MMKKILLLVTVLCFVLSCSVSADEGTLMILNELEIMQGDLQGNLNLENYVTRAEFTKMAVNSSIYRNSVALNLKISPYKDVTFKEWYAPYVKTASDNGLVKGYSDGAFRPESTVLYEEAVTVLLRLLGYTDDDFGASWPYGQMGIAQSIGLCDNVNASIGQDMKRSEVAVLFGNFLRTNLKDSTSEYISKLQYTISDDVVLIATANEDTSVGSGKILTSSGTYKLMNDFDNDLIGKKGTAVVNNNGELALFIPSVQNIREYTVYQVLNNSIIVTENGSLSSVELENELVVYNKSEKTNLKNASASLSVGDALRLYSNENGINEYGIIKTDELKGPYTVKSSNQIYTYGLSNPVINKNGESVNSDQIQLNDIIYYSNKLNTVWVYSKKITGIYENATPNKDNPTSVTLSGQTYSIEGVEAFTKLSTGGVYSLGDTVTFLLGKDGDVADVISPTSNDDYVYGYLIETGTKTFTQDGGNYSAYYVKIVAADGTESTYATKTDCTALKNKAVIVKFDSTGKYANVSTAKTTSSVAITTDDMASDVKILEISTDAVNLTSNYSTVFKSRLEDVKIKASQIVFLRKNASGKISELVIKDVTGDLNKYGIVTSVEGQDNKSYTVNVKGEKINVSNSKIYSVIEGQPCKIVYNGNSVDTLSSLKKLTTAVKNITETKITVGTNDYLISQDISVFVRTAGYDYMMVSLSEIIENQKDYTIYAYYDNLPENGGRIRILTAIKN